MEKIIPGPSSLGAKSVPLRGVNSPSLRGFSLPQVLVSNMGSVCCVSHPRWEHAKFGGFKFQKKHFQRRRSHKRHQIFLSLLKKTPKTPPGVD